MKADTAITITPVLIQEWTEQAAKLEAEVHAIRARIDAAQLLLGLGTPPFVSNQRPTQIAVEADGFRIVASGDYKNVADPTCAPFELVPCDVFITEATFALPVFRHGDAGLEIAKICGNPANL